MHRSLTIAALLPCLLLMPSFAHADEQFCGPLASDVMIIDVQQFEREDSDGTKHWSSTVTYTLSTGQRAEVMFTVDARENGEAHFAVDGVVVAYASYQAGEPGVTQTWVAPELSDQQEVAAELLQESVADVLLDGLIPQAIECSSFGKGVMRGVKYLWIGVTAAAAAGCCAGTGILGCTVCATGAAAAGVAGVDAANRHCD